MVSFSGLSVTPGIRVAAEVPSALKAGGPSLASLPASPSSSSSSSPSLFLAGAGAPKKEFCPPKSGLMLLKSPLPGYADALPKMLEPPNKLPPPKPIAVVVGPPNRLFPENTEEGPPIAVEGV